jgi:hypothetical protein
MSPVLEGISAPVDWVPSRKRGIAKRRGVSGRYASLDKCLSPEGEGHELHKSSPIKAILPKAWSGAFTHAVKVFSIRVPQIRDDGCLRRRLFGQKDGTAPNQGQLGEIRGAGGGFPSRTPRIRVAPPRPGTGDDGRRAAAGRKHLRDRPQTVASPIPCWVPIV